MRYFLVIITALFLSCTLNAQVRGHVSVNLDVQPIWGPVGNDYAQCYYLPDIEAYYSVPLRLFYFFERGRWVSHSTLPVRFRNFDLFRSYKVVLNEPKPWLHHDSYRDKYISFKGRHDQELIRDSHDSKYFVNKNHPEHNKWIQEQKHDNRSQKNVKLENRDDRSQKNMKRDNRDDRNQKNLKKDNRGNDKDGRNKER